MDSDYSHNFVCPAIFLAVITATDFSGGTITYGYDALDRVNRETTANGSIGYGYDAGGRLTSMQAPNQSLVTYGYD